jgi:hypothetical protein
MFGCPILVVGIKLRWPFFDSLQFSYGETMKEKVKKLNLQRDYKKYLYFIDGEGNVCQKSKSGEGDSKVLVEHAVDRDNRFLYFIDKDGDVARSARSAGRKKAA